MLSANSPTITPLISNKIKQFLPLQGSDISMKHYDDFESNDDGENCKHQHKGACCLPSFIRRGSMTLEATLVLPLFIFAMISCMLFGQMLVLKGRMHQGLAQAAMDMAVMEYKEQKSGRHTNTAQLRILQKKYADIDDLPLIINISGLNFIGTKIPNDMDEIEVHMNYSLTINPPLGNIQKMKITDIIYQKAFTGYMPSIFETGDGCVYVAKYGTVYHKSLSCSHIMLSIAGSGKIQDYLDGKTRYQACKKCAKHASGDITQLFIPKEGDCYHVSLSCSGLTRDVREISIWETGGLKPCSRCGN